MILCLFSHTSITVSLTSWVNKYPLRLSRILLLEKKAVEGFVHTIPEPNQIDFAPLRKPSPIVLLFTAKS